MIKQKNWLKQLSEAGVENPAQELRYIKRYAETDHQIDEIVARRAKREPLAKIIGYKEFWKHNFITNEHTLDPRPDSEILIETCFKLLRHPEKSEGFRSILELGVGTGCLILSLLDELQDSLGIGVDLSKDALEVAQKNSIALGLASRIQLIQSDWFSKVPTQEFDLIISNPPYINLGEDINEEAQYDPKMALYAKDNGLADYKKILKNAAQFLKPNGYLIFEIGPSWQYYKGEDHHGLTMIDTINDLSVHQRVVVFQKLS